MPAGSLPPKGCRAGCDSTLAPQPARPAAIRYFPGAEVAASFARLPGAGGVCGAAEIGFAAIGGASRLRHLYQHDPLRVLFPLPEPGEGVLAVLVTTSGGLVAGDDLNILLRAEPGAVAHVTTSAAEKVYRSTGATTSITQSCSIAPGGWLEYLPQETILFDGARLRRHTIVELAASAGFVGGGIIVFGRRARGERFTAGLLHERIEIHRDGRLVWGDALHIDGDVASIMADPASFDNAAACATLVLVPPNGDPARFVDSGRAVQQRSATMGRRAGITVVNGIVVARWLAAEPAALRRAFAELACHWRQAAMGLPPRLPRLWHS
jgi:urease accessory protein